MSETDFDFVIIGAGTAGCLLANRLSADPARRVLLVEAGGRDNHPWIHIPVGYLYCIDNPRTDWCFRTAAEAGLQGRSLLYPRGRTLGGSSSINGMIYMRGQARDYAHWAEATGDEDWDWLACLPDFMRHEHHYRLETSARHAAHKAGASGTPGAAGQTDAVGRSAAHPPGTGQACASVTDAARHGDFADFAGFHGHGGEWRVEKQRLRWDILDAFAQAAQQAGIPASDDFNRGDNFGVGYFEVNQKAGWRWNAAKAFLHPVRTQRRNLVVWTHTRMERLHFARGSDGRLRCSGAELVREGQAVHVTAQAEVILSAGAIGTPQILQLSGLGPGHLLQSHGVPVRLDLPGVGANLQDHLQLRMVFKVSGVETLNTAAQHWWGKARIGLEYLFRRSGPMSMAPSQLGAFTRSDPQQAWPNLQYHVQPLSLEAFGQPLHDFPAFTASVCNLNPTSRGKVTLRDACSQSAPLIQPNYLSTGEDRAVAVAALRTTRNIVAQAALQAYAPQEIKPGLACQSDAELADAAGLIGTTIFHPVGTAKMGREDDPMAVVDSHLRVRGVQGLRVVDASVMPRITSGNTNSPTLMIAEKAARWILAGR